MSAREPAGAASGPGRDEGCVLIGMRPGTKVFLACKPIDLRNGFDGLSAKVQAVLRQDPFSGHLFVVRGRVAIT